jgi:5,10-methylene-tetrahydrofolate dehydrogenase/methenyl tetrahydrofolate cyclohydrolase
VKAVPRELKMDMFLSGELDGVQIYDVMEALELEQRGGRSPGSIPAAVVLPLCGRQGSNLGYAQAIFMPTSQLANEEQVHYARSFMAATEAGWFEAIKDPARAAEIVLGMQPTREEVGHHWRDSLSFTTNTVRRCNEYVKATRRGPKLLTVDPVQWAKADQWILSELHGGGGGSSPLVGTSQKSPSGSHGTSQKSPSGSHGTSQKSPSDSHGSHGTSQKKSDMRRTLETGVWKVHSNLMVGHDVVQPMRASIREQAARVAAARHGRPPSLAIVSFGDGPARGESGSGSGSGSSRRRQELYSPQQHSWFSREATGQSLGVHVSTVVLLPGGGGGGGSGGGGGGGGSAAHLLSQRRCEAELRKLREFDGIQLTEPVPPHLDVPALVRAMRPSQDVDSRGYASGDVATLPPLTVAATMRLLKHYGVTLRGKTAVVVGKGPLVGFPLAKALSEEGATVSLAHGNTPEGTLRGMVERADVIFPCVGQPGVIDASWIPEGAVVCNVGTYFDPIKEELLPDVANVETLLLLPDDDDRRNGKRNVLVGSCPGGVGPLVVAELFQRVVDTAADNCTRVGVLNPTHHGADARSTALLGMDVVLARLASSLDQDWCLGQAAAGSGSGSGSGSVDDSTDSRGGIGGGGNTSIPALKRRFHFASFGQATQFVTAVSTAADAMNHHPNLRIVHRCTAGFGGGCGLGWVGLVCAGGQGQWCGCGLLGLLLWLLRVVEGCWG